MPGSDWRELPGADALVGSGACLLVIAREFFVEFFAGAYAGEADLNILVGPQAVAGDQLPGEIDDFHLRPHVQHEDFAPLPDGAGLHDELAGLGDGHEISLHVRMRHGHRPARFDLLLENRNYAPTASRDIAETDGDEFSGVT